ncbi:hypothetical protein Mgra_00009965 [Meloidogyne graminicola]|uniref:Uncharacterized protein n=1 Tax=Meloidogyne graminicola TaxID=189291 RepID=A0A8S9ZAV8_9BILA|nr:hypothetical protein Mgra_00009965 [Meloidogyne graminicola]
MFFVQNTNFSFISTMFLLSCLKLCFCSTTFVLSTTNYENNTKEVNNTNNYGQMNSSSLAMNEIYPLVNASNSSDTSFETIDKAINQTETFHQGNLLFVNATIEFFNFDKSNPCGWNNLTNVDKRTLIILINEKADKEDIRVAADNILVPRWMAFCVSLGVVLIILIVAILLFIICCNGRK